jgi:hypothetical protein
MDWVTAVRIRSLALLDVTENLFFSYLISAFFLRIDQLKGINLRQVANNRISIRRQPRKYLPKRLNTL